MHCRCRMPQAPALRLDLQSFRRGNRTAPRGLRVRGRVVLLTCVGPFNCVRGPKCDGGGRLLRDFGHLGRVAKGRKDRVAGDCAKARERMRPFMNHFTLINRYL